MAFASQAPGNPSNHTGKRPKPEVRVMALEHFMNFWRLPAPPPGHPVTLYARRGRVGGAGAGQPGGGGGGWSLAGTPSASGFFGAPTGAGVHVMGITHAEWGEWGLRREFTLIDEVAIWKQILLHLGEI